MHLRVSLVIAIPALVAASFLVPDASVAASPTSGPTLAVEDTMHTEVSEVLVRAPRVTLEEILDRVARGEARRESLMVDQTFTAALRVVRNVSSPKPELLMETVTKAIPGAPA